MANLSSTMSKPLLLNSSGSNLTHCWIYKADHMFPKGINLKVNGTTRLEFELAHYDVSHYITEPLPHFISRQAGLREEKLDSKPEV